MTMIGSLRGLEDVDFRGQDAEFQLLLGLNQDRFNAVCVLLQGEGIMELSLFRENVQRLLERGYPLKSLVADLYCSSVNGVPQFWTCDVRPEIGAKARKTSRLIRTLERQRLILETENS